MNNLAQVLTGTLLTAPSREKIAAYEKAIAEHLPPYDPKVDHVFAPGVYARAINMPAGTTYTSKIHKTEHLVIVCSGRVTVSTDKEVSVVRGPCIFTTKPNTKRAVYVHEDCVWITIHATEETDLEKIEEQVIAKDYLEDEQ